MVCDFWQLYSIWAWRAEEQVYYMMVWHWYGKGMKIEKAGKALPVSRGK